MQHKTDVYIEAREEKLSHTQIAEEITAKER
jgi:hypothetical protein